MITSSSDIVGEMQQNFDVVLTSSESEFVPDTQESCSDKLLVKDCLMVFRDRIKLAKSFAVDTVSSI